MFRRNKSSARIYLAFCYWKPAKMAPSWLITQVHPSIDFNRMCVSIYTRWLNRWKEWNNKNTHAIYYTAMIINYPIKWNIDACTRNKRNFTTQNSICCWGTLQKSDRYWIKYVLLHSANLYAFRKNNNAQMQFYYI